MIIVVVFVTCSKCGAVWYNVFFGPDNVVTCPLCRNIIHRESESRNIGD